MLLLKLMSFVCCFASRRASVCAYFFVALLFLATRTEVGAWNIKSKDVAIMIDYLGPKNGCQVHKLGRLSLGLRQLTLRHRHRLFASEMVAIVEICRSSNSTEEGVFHPYASLLWAVENHSQAAVSLLDYLQPSPRLIDDNRLLFAAVQADNKDLLRRVLNRRLYANINERSITHDNLPLAMAIQARRLDTANLLVSHGAKVGSLCTPQQLMNQLLLSPPLSWLSCAKPSQANEVVAQFDTLTLPLQLQIFSASPYQQTPSTTAIPNAIPVIPGNPECNGKEFHPGFFGSYETVLGYGVKSDAGSTYLPVSVMSQFSVEEGGITLLRLFDERNMNYMRRYLDEDLSTESMNWHLAGYLWDNEDNLIDSPSSWRPLIEFEQRPRNQQNMIREWARQYFYKTLLTVISDPKMRRNGYRLRFAGKSTLNRISENIFDKALLKGLCEWSKLLQLGIHGWFEPPLRTGTVKGRDHRKPYRFRPELALCDPPCHSIKPIRYLNVTGEHDPELILI
eukprot:GILJ01004441.1.p1 GENE.GILJ01004441.1~~GILJ01004441.1.p1  ORF type:complete len:509 (+),score=67.07 GILJ01004441.1:39-1565(+)